MPLSFKRFLQVCARVKLGGAPPLNVINLDGEGLTIMWDIFRPRRGPEEGTITIVNLSEAARGFLHTSWKTATKKQVVVVEPDVAHFLVQGVGSYEVALKLAERNASAPYGFKVDLGIGWEKRPSLVYRGDAIGMQPGKRVGVDVHTIFTLGSQAWQDAAVGASFANVTLSLIVQFLIQAPPPNGFGVQIEPASLAKIEQRGAELGVREYVSWARAGKTSEVVDDILASLGLEGKIHNGRFIVTDRGNAATASLDAFFLSPGTGLLDWTETDDGGIEALALAIPDVSPGAQVAIVDENATPVGAARHRVESVRFTGTTEGQSTMVLECRKAVLL
jgi:hypothetical protein